MSLAHDPYKLYEFLSSSTQEAPDNSAPELLVPHIIDGMQYLTDLAITKEAPAASSIWQTRLHVGNEVRTANAETIADNYLAHLGSTGIRDVRLFELDRPLPPSPSGASNIRLSVAAEPGVPRQLYNYKLTMYTPRSPTRPGQQDEFDEDLYQQLLAEGHLGPRGAERAVVATLAQRVAADSAKTALAPLPEIASPDIYSQFAFTLLPTETEKAGLYTHTFRPASEKSAQLATLIDSPHDDISAAYNADRQRLTPWQRMILDNRGAHATAHFDLSLALRHLAGDKLEHHQQQ